MYFERIIDDYRKQGRKFYPAPQESIDKLLKIWGRLPTAYLEFLRVMGGGGDGVVDKNSPPEREPFMVGEDFYTDKLFELKDRSAKLLEENNAPFALKDDDFVFWMSQGVMFAYFNINEGYDPPVYFYSEGDNASARKVADSFSEFIWNMYKHPAEALQAAESSDYDKGEEKQSEKTAKKILGIVAAVGAVSLMIFLIKYAPFMFDYLTR